MLLAPNHFSYLDHFFVAVLLRREVQFMAKSQLFRPPVLDFIINHGGTFPVRRGHRDEEAFITAHSIFDRGGTVLMYAEGGRQRTQGDGPAQAGPRQAGARVRRAGRADRDPRLRACARGKARGAPEGDRAVRLARDASSGSSILRASARRRSRSRSSTACARCTRRSRSRAAAACSRASAASAAKARPSPASDRQSFRRTCQLTVISATFVPCASVSSTSTGNSTFPSASSRESSASLRSPSVPVAVIGPFASFR